MVSGFHARDFYNSSLSFLASLATSSSRSPRASVSYLLISRTLARFGSGLHGGGESSDERLEEEDDLPSSAGAAI